MPDKITNQPFLTIGIASYNYGKYLVRAFDQIKKQQFHDIEILYCDDGSTDDSITIIQELIHDNPEWNIRLISGKNAGILENKNRILENARGIYLLICDADDYMLDTCLADLCSAARVQNADCVIGGFEEIDSRGHILKSHVPSEKSSKWLYTWHHAQIYKTEIVRRHGIRFTSLPDDIAFLQQIHLYSNHVAFVCKPLYAWVRHDDSVSRNVLANAEWNPLFMWTQVTVCIAQLFSLLPTDRDRRDLNYYLYKWFYFNISDLPLINMKNTKENIRTMQNQMASVYPDYRKLSFLHCSLKTPDTLFARMAVTLCWILESVNLLFIIPFLRTQQNKLRRRREEHGKT